MAQKRFPKDSVAARTNSSSSFTAPHPIVA
jgi:hypothetical protein